MQASAQVIRNTVKSLYMQGVIARKGWDDQYAAMIVVNYLTCGKAISFHDFMESAE